VTTSAEHVRFTPGSRHGGNCFALVRVRWRPITALNGRQHLKQFGRSDNEEYRSDRTEPASELLRIAIALLGGRLRDPRSSPRAHRWRRSWSCGRGAAAAVAMSELGQSRRSDRGLITSGLPQEADIFRYRRHVSNVPCVDGSELARTFLRMQHWSVQPCVRPLGAVHMTAGHNALRGSGPGQKHAFKRCGGTSGLS
jgi:hypothetical protein